MVQEIAGPQIETTLPFIPSEESTLPTELFTTPIEATEPTENENILPQMLVQPEPSDDDFVLVRTYIPDVFVDLLNIISFCNFIASPKEYIAYAATNFLRKRILFRSII